MLVHFGASAIKTHNLQTILDLLAMHCIPPGEVAVCSELTDYAVTTRYPGVYEPVTREEYEDAIRTAGAVVAWAANVVGSDS